MGNEESLQTSVDELTKLQLDYGWKWFQFHATQRTTMFNYFLIIAGILVTAYVSLRKDGYWLMAGALGLLGSLIAAGFFCLDIRNRQLVEYGEDVLVNLEAKLLFNPKPASETPQAHAAVIPTILRRDNDTDRGWRDLWLRHKFWIRLIEVCIGAFLLALGLHALSQGASKSTSKDVQHDGVAAVAQMKAIHHRQEVLIQGVTKLQNLVRADAANNRLLRSEIKVFSKKRFRSSKGIKATVKATRRHLRRRSYRPRQLEDLAHQRGEPRVRPLDSSFRSANTCVAEPCLPDHETGLGAGCNAVRDGIASVGIAAGMLHGRAVNSGASPLILLTGSGVESGAGTATSAPYPEAESGKPETQLARGEARFRR